jgi:hypothetical protein
VGLERGSLSLVSTTEDRGPGFDSRALPGKQNSGSGTGSTQPHEYNWGQGSRVRFPGTTRKK